MNAQARTTRVAVTVSFAETLSRHEFPRLARAPLQELQVNVGRLCNQACNHCHVDAGPKRTEIMTWETMERILAWAERARIAKVDITGGAPEVNPDFRRFVDRWQALGVAVTARCNLTVLSEPGQDDLAAWYAARGVRLVASLPCYTRENVDAQRGKGVFDKSIAALRALNTAGYGRRPELVLDLVYNPGGAFLPGNQAKLEADYKKRLKEDHGIDFNRLFTIANLPINRFAHALERDGKYDEYMQLLVDNFNPATVPGLMCRHLVSVDWLGLVYDCDFNQMLDLPLGGMFQTPPTSSNPGVVGGRRRYLWDLDAAALTDAPIATGPHCFGCTAGAGSSCGGALT
ncbi:MAG: arsenosugar biosynthesis radical SAM (seleno)protein ArsS [Gammaproteobacteria bacterium]